MNKETWIYNKKKKKYVKANKFTLFKHRIKIWIKKWKFIDLSKYKLIPYSEIGRAFFLSKKEYEESERLYKEEHRTISYEFYPGGGIGWGVRIHDLKTKEVFDITDYESW